MPAGLDHPVERCLAKNLFPGLSTLNDVRHYGECSGTTLLIKRLRVRVPPGLRESNGPVAQW